MKYSKLQKLQLAYMEAKAEYSEVMNDGLDDEICKSFYDEMIRAKDELESYQKNASLTNSVVSY